MEDQNSKGENTNNQATPEKIDFTVSAPEFKTTSRTVPGGAPIGWLESKSLPVNGVAKAPTPEDERKAKLRKKALIGALGALGVLVVLLMILGFAFLAQPDPSANPIAQLLGLNQASFVNGLIALINSLFILICLVFFGFTMMGLLKVASAQKFDVEKKRKGLKIGAIAGSSLIVILIIWVFVFIYLDGKRVVLDDENPNLAVILTDPVDTTNLTAPIVVKFDASNVPYDSRNFNIISYRWDFGDGTVGTDRIVTHEYKNKGQNGRFDVVLTVTRRSKQTGEEFRDQYNTIVTIANQALTATITATPISGPAPLEVKFDASKSVDPDGTISSYDWDFDNDNEFDDASGTQVSYKFDKIGRYQIGLRVVSATGEFAISKQEIIVEEDSLPTAVITINNEPESFVVQTPYVFQGDDSTAVSGNVVKYEWDFGDGSPVQNTKTASHSFAREGSYTVKLKVIDSQEKENTTEKTIVVGSPKGVPRATITSDPVGGATGIILGKAPFTVVFDGSASTDSDNNIVDYEWDFNGDGAPDGFGPKTSYTFTSEGTYNVKLTVVDSDKNAGTTSAVVRVEATGIVPDIKADKIEGTVPMTVTFDASGSTFDNGRIVSYEWDFGTGSSPTLGDSKISFKYTSIGTFKARVRVVGSDNTSATKEVLITVREVPLKACFVSVFEEGPAPLETTFDPGCSTGTVTSYFWDFGDGSTSAAVKPAHTYQSPGAYRVTLEVTDSKNIVSQSELTINVTP